MYHTVESRIRSIANDNNWNLRVVGCKFYEKDGYEIYFFDKNDGFELTIRDPETSQRRPVLEVRDDDIDTASPMYVAILKYVLENAETIVSQS